MPNLTLDSRTHHQTHTSAHVHQYTTCEKLTNCPSHIQPRHWDELVNGSAIPPDLAAKHFQSMEGEGIIEWLAGSELDQLGGHSQQFATAPVRHIYARYKSVTEGGWVFQGLDPLNNFEPMNWGCFKADSPRKSRDGKTPKYEHPTKTPTRVFIAGDSESWRGIVNDPSADVTIGEGAKKTASLQGQGHVTVGIPGITQWNIPGTRELKPELEVFAQSGRTLYICFDQDTKRSTRRAVEREIHKLGAALRRRGCKVRVMTWDPKLGKGIDDVIANHGPEALQAIYGSAIRFECWALRKQSDLTFEPDWVAPEGQKYLEPNGEKIPFPAEEKFLAIKAPKGTGKTEVIKGLVDEAHAEGRRVLLVSHRQQLTQNLCDRVGVPSIYEVKEAKKQGREQAKADVAANGMGLCVASLHPLSQAQFKAEEWRNALIIIDEAEQVIWEMLNSATCRDNRVAIIRAFKTLMMGALSPDTEGRVILADADLSDVSIDFVRQVGERPELKPWLAVSNWKGDGYRCHFYECPEDNLIQAEAAIERGAKLLVMTDSQRSKGKFSSTALEARWKRMFPDKKILVGDSKTLHQKNHPAYGAIADREGFDGLLGQYDIVIFTPSLETGVSIDLTGHFDAVYGFFQGVLGENSIRQSLMRLRDLVPRHIYVAPRGLEFVGAGETHHGALADTQQKTARTALRLLFDAGCDDIDSDFSRAPAVAWAKMGARHNTGMAALSECVLQGLRDEGQTVIGVPRSEDDDGSQTELKAELKAERHDRIRQQAEAVSAATAVDERELEQLEKARSIESEEQALAIRKAKLQQRYGKEDITPDLDILDQDGYAARVRLHYYLTVGRDHHKNQGRAEINQLLENNGRRLWAPDVVKATLSTRIAVFEHFKILELLQLEEFSENTPEVIALAEAVQGHYANIRVAAGVNLHGATKRDGTTDSIEIVRRFLKPLGFTLPSTRKEGPRGAQAKVYAPTQVDSKRFNLGDQGEAVYQVDRAEIFSAWLERDAAADKQPETPVIQEIEPVVTQDLVSSHGNRRSLLPPGGYQTPTPNKRGAVDDQQAPSPTENREVVPPLSHIENVCLEILQTCDCWGQYVSVQAEVGIQRLGALWARLTDGQRRRITRMQPVAGG